MLYTYDLAIEEGYDYILTMNRDTEFEKGSLMRLIKFIHSDGKNYFIVAPNIKLVICNGDKKNIN